MRVPLFKDHPTFRPLPGVDTRRVLIVLAPTEADVPAVRSLGRRLRRLGVDAVATTECQGEVRGEHSEPLFPNLLLIEAAQKNWDAVVVAGGSGALRVAEDAFARQVIRAVSSAGKPIAALGLGRIVLERAGIRGYLDEDPNALGRWLGKQLGIPRPETEVHRPWRRRLTRRTIHLD